MSLLIPSVCAVVAVITGAKLAVTAIVLLALLPKLSVTVTVMLSAPAVLLVSWGRPVAGQLAQRAGR